MNNPFPIYQDEREIEELAWLVAELRPARILEVGSLVGGTLWHWFQVAKPGALIVSLDKLIAPFEVQGHIHTRDEIMRYRDEWLVEAQKANVRLWSVIGDSTEPTTVESVRAFVPFDFIFVDGDHHREVVESDFRNYFPMLAEGGVMAFHDVAERSDLGAQMQVGAWWSDLIAEGKYKTEEILRTGERRWGIGVIYKENG